LHDRIFLAVTVQYRYLCSRTLSSWPQARQWRRVDTVKWSPIC